MNPLNPLNDPTIVYLRTLLAVRIDKMRSEQERSLGVSAVEWAIITGVVAVIALGIYAIIKPKIEGAASSINTGYK
jgi:adenylosuccinate lyase